jgi:RHS repeat-associated protein
VKHLEYDAFGKLINKSGAISVPFFRYTGKFTDDTTELQWNINRWYDANVGRWISEDRIAFVVGDENLYRYVGNKAEILIDSMGLNGEEPNVLFQNLLGTNLLMAWVTKAALSVTAINYILKMFGDPEIFLVRKNLVRLFDLKPTTKAMKNIRDSIKESLCCKEDKSASNKFNGQKTLVFDSNTKTVLDYVLGTSTLMYKGDAFKKNTQGTQYSYRITWMFIDTIDANSFLEAYILLALEFSVL